MAALTGTDTHYSGAGLLCWELCGCLSVRLHLSVTHTFECGLQGAPPGTRLCGMDPAGGFQAKDCQRIIKQQLKSSCMD